MEGYSCSDSGGNELVSGDLGIVNDEDDVVGDSVVSTEANEESGGNALDVLDVDSAVSSVIRVRVERQWWKMPLALVKLYNLKKKAQRFHLIVAIDDKKVSRVMNQAVRLNEMLTDVRRVPVIRPALPSPSAWPVLSLR